MVPICIYWDLISTNLKIGSNHHCTGFCNTVGSAGGIFLSHASFVVPGEVARLTDCVSLIIRNVNNAGLLGFTAPAVFLKQHLRGINKEKEDNV